MDWIRSMQELNERLVEPFILLLVKTHTCSVCDSVSDQLEKILQEKKGIDLHVIYADDLEAFRGQHLVFTVPTVLVFSEGKEIFRESRFIDFNRIKRLIEIYQS